MNIFGGGRSGIKTVLQAQASECGLACLAMIANFHGHRIDIAYMRSLLAVSRKGNSLAQLADAASRLGLDARGFALESTDELSKVALPCILHWDGTHFVVLESISGGKFTIHNPAFGKRILPAADVREHFSGVVLELEPRMNFTAVRQSRGSTLIPLLKATRGLGSTISHLLILSLAISVLGLMTPILLQVALDTVLPQFDLDLLTLLVLGLGGFMIFEATGRWLRDIVILRAAQLFQTSLTRNVVNHAFRLPLNYFELRHPGDMIARLDSLTHVKQTLAGGLVTALADSIMSILLVAMMFFYSPVMTVIVLLTVVILLALRFMFLPRIKNYTTASLEAHSVERAHLLDGLREVRSVKAANAADFITGRWYDSFVRYVNADYLAKRSEYGVDYLLHVLFAVSTVTTLYVGITGVMQSTLSIGMLYAFFFLRQSFFERVEHATRELIHLSLTGVHLARMDDIIFEEAEGQESGQPMRRFIRRTVALENVTVQFSEADGAVLQGVDLSIDVAKQEAIAIIGPSGAGKSSLLRLLASLQKPHSGQLTIDSIPLARFGTLEYRSNIGAVFAEDGLFSGSVADNLSLFNPEISVALMQDALQTVGLADVVAELPQGLGTVIANEGGILSTGQRRRLLVARALCREPRLLLLDEVTANLDPATERALVEHILAVPCAKVFVTHSTSLLSRMDRVYSIQNGRLVAEDRPLAGIN